MIELIDVTKTFNPTKSDSIKALDNINLKFKKGEVIVLKGSSGSGKSTLLSLIAALNKPTSGEVIVDNQRVSKLPDDFASLYRRETIGFIFQKYNLIPNLSVIENILLPLIPNNPEKKEVSKLLQEVMKKFNIEHKKDSIVNTLSGGEQQRVAIARAHINNPKIIIADEPTANLDERLKNNFIDILKDLKQSNKTIIIASHDPVFFELDFVDKVVQIDNGKIV